MSAPGGGAPPCAPAGPQEGAGLPQAGGWPAQLRALAARLGQTAVPAALAAALTHPSYAHERPDAGPDYERLEFLGDAAVGLLASELLAARWPAADEGELSQRRAAMVCRAALAGLAGELGLAACLRRGRGEPADPGARVLAAVLEAVAGALYLAGGMAALRGALGAPLARLAALPRAGGDAKTALQERCQARGMAPPDYRVVACLGPAHARHFRVEVWVGGRCVGTAAGARKKDAQQAGAALALSALAAADEPEPCRR